MQEKIKEIIAAFTKTSPGSVHSGTLIDRSALKSSIMLHRMYARLSEEGIIVANYLDIKTAGDLFRITASVDSPSTGDVHVISHSLEKPLTDGPVFSGASGIGIDIEETANMPVVPDFREDEFYKMNFTAQEIAYCILRTDPYASFAGLFAAKEAIVKACEAYRKRSFNTIPIDHLTDGRPVHEGFQLSISHTRGVAVAVAASIVSDLSDRSAYSLPMQPSAGKTSSSWVWIAILSLLLSVLAVILVLVR